MLSDEGMVVNKVQALDVHVRLSVYERMGLCEESSSLMQPERPVSVYLPTGGKGGAPLITAKQTETRMSLSAEITVDIVPVPNHQTKAFSTVVW